IPEMGFTHATNVLVRTMEEEPKLVAGMARAMAKSLVFMAAADPAELAKLHFKLYPETRPTGMSESEAIRLEVTKLRAREPFMRFRQRVFERTEKLGDVLDSQIESYRDVLYAAGQIPAALPASSYFTRQFLDYANEIDIDGLIRAARNFTA